MQSGGAKSYLTAILKGVLITLIVNTLGIILFAVIIKVAMLNGSVIRPVNQFIKLLAIFLGCMFSLKGKRGLINGVLVGLFGSAITYLLFALIVGEPTFSGLLILDVLFGLIVGGLSGILTVNVKKE